MGDTAGWKINESCTHTLSPAFLPLCHINTRLIGYNPVILQFGLTRK